MMSRHQCIQFLSIVLVAFALAGCEWFVSGEERVARAERLMSEGDDRAAAIELKNALKSHPENIRARLLLARLSLRAGDAKLAEKELELAADAGAAAHDTAELWAETQLALGRSRELLEQLADGIAGLTPVQISVYRGEAHLELKEFEQALESFESALANDANSVRALIGAAQVHANAGKLDEALGMLQRAVSVDSTDARAWWLIGNVLLRQGDLPKASEAYERALQEAPGSLSQVQRHRVIVSLIESYLSMGQAERARQHLVELQRLIPDAPATRLLAARAAMLEQDYSGAIAETQKVLSATPELVQARLLLGMALVANGDLNQAEAQLGRVVREWPENLEARKLLAQVLLRSGREHAAAELLRSMGASELDDPQIGSLRGQVSLLSGDTAAAIESLERSASAHPENVALKLDLGFAYLVAGRAKDALDVLSATPEDPGNVRRQTLMLAAIAATKGTSAARDELQRLVAAHPNSAEVSTIAAAFYAQHGDLARAREQMQAALKADAKYVPAMLGASRLEMLAGDKVAAQRYIDQALALDGKNVNARVVAARIAADARDIEAALTHLEAARAADERALEPRLLMAELLIRQNRVREADQVIREATALAGGNVRATGAIGKLYLSLGRYDDALARFREALRIEPDDPDLHVNIARAHSGRGDAAAARASAERARQLEPASLPATSLLVALDLREGRQQQAKDLVTQLRKLRPEHPAVAVLEGDVSMATGGFAAAAQAYERAYRLSPAGIVAVKNLDARTKGRLAQPSALVDDWLRQHPSDVVVRMALASSLTERGQRRDAIREYERIVAAGNPSPIALNNLAWLYFEEKDERAVELAKRAWELAPELPAVADTYGWVLLQAGRTEAALPILQQAFDKAPSSPEIQFHYAVALARSGRSAEASELLGRLLTDYPSFSAADQARQLLAELRGG